MQQYLLFLVYEKNKNGHRMVPKLIIFFYIYPFSVFFRNKKRTKKYDKPVEIISIITIGTIA